MSKQSSDGPLATMNPNRPEPVRREHTVNTREHTVNTRERTVNADQRNKTRESKSSDGKTTNAGAGANVGATAVNKDASVSRAVNTPTTSSHAPVPSEVKKNAHANDTAAEPEQTDQSSMTLFGLKQLLVHPDSPVRGAVYGGVIGLTLYSLLNYLDRQTSQPDVRKLNPEPLAFGIDTTLYPLFDRLSLFRKYAEEEYVKAIKETDRMLTIEQALRNGCMPRIEDLPLAQTHFEMAMNAVLRIEHTCTDPVDSAVLKQIKTQIMTRLATHLTDIARACRQLPVPTLPK